MLDEESIPASFNGVSGKYGISQFQYELIRVQDDDRIFQVLAPQPTEYNVGDNFSETIKLYLGITFDTLVSNYAFKSGRALQKGTLRIDGIM